MGPCVMSLELESAPHALLQGQTEPMVIGDLVVLNGADLSKQWVGTARGHRARSGQRRVVVEAAIEVIAMRTEVLQLERAVAPELAIDAEAPLVHRGRGQVGIVGDDVRDAGGICRAAGERVEQRQRRQSGTASV